MKTINFAHLQVHQPTASAPRSQREDLIQQIVAQCVCTPGQAKTLAKLLAITANAAKWTEMDLHALLKKKQDPSIRNYTAFVRWSTKIVSKK